MAETGYYYLQDIRGQMYKFDSSFHFTSGATDVESEVIRVPGSRHAFQVGDGMQNPANTVGNGTLMAADEPTHRLQLIELQQWLDRALYFGRFDGVRHYWKKIADNPGKKRGWIDSPEPVDGQFWISKLKVTIVTLDAEWIDVRTKQYVGNII